ncbi:MAG TPA: hypothetical protein VHV49_19370 [Pseudonocardiaceae bacterium]|nr:hypothetical protein [Pseudonocardiaceae bacterium]
MSSLRHLGTSVPGSFGFPLGAALAVLVTIALVGDGGTGHPGWAVTALAASVAVLSVLTTPAAVLGTAALSWFLLEGFVVGREGQITLTAASMRAAAALLLTALACIVVTTAIRVLAAPARTSTEGVPASG